MAHSAIDAEHAREVRNIIERVAKTADDWASIGETAETSLRLTGRMLDEVHAEYMRLMSGESSRYVAVRAALFPNQ